MRAYHDPEGLAKIGLPAEKFQQSIVGAKILIKFYEDFGMDEIMPMVRQVIDKKNLNSKQPDVVFHEHGNPIAVVVIEIEDHAEFKHCKDVVRGHLESYPDVQEGFAYNMDKSKWVRFYREYDDILQEESSESEYFGCDFADYLL